MFSLAVSDIRKIIYKVWKPTNDATQMGLHVVDCTDFIHSIRECHLDCIENIFNRPVNWPVWSTEEESVARSEDFRQGERVVMRDQVIHNEAFSEREESKVKVKEEAQRELDPIDRDWN